MKKGYQISFMAPRSQHHHGKPMLDAIIAIAKAHGIRRYTLRTDTESVGQDGRTHASRFFELSDEPEELLFILGMHKSEMLLEAVRAEAMHVFCIRRPIEFGHLDESDEDVDL